MSKLAILVAQGAPQAPSASTNICLFLLFYIHFRYVVNFKEVHARDNLANVALLTLLTM